MTIQTIMMHKTMAASMLNHVAISKKDYETFGNNGHDKPRLNLSWGNRLTGMNGVQAPDLMRLLITIKAKTGCRARRNWLILCTEFSTALT